MSVIVGVANGVSGSRGGAVRVIVWPPVSGLVVGMPYDIVAWLGPTIQRYLEA
jgi:hypothetical protein